MSDGNSRDASAGDTAAADTDELVALPPAGRRTALLVGIPVAVVMALLVFLLATSDAAVDRVADSPLIGQVAPLISGTAIDGEPFDLDAQQGRWVVVNFFASTCIPCVQEHPELVQFQQSHAEAGDATIVSVAFDDSPGNVRRFFDDNGGDWPVLTEDTGGLAVRYGVIAVPESYLVAPNGVVVAKVVGGVTAAFLDELIDQASGASA